MGSGEEDSEDVGVRRVRLAHQFQY
jgi:hypothetical protein